MSVYSRRDGSLSERDPRSGGAVSPSPDRFPGVHLRTRRRSRKVCSQTDQGGTSVTSRLDVSEQPKGHGGNGAARECNERVVWYQAPVLMTIFQLSHCVIAVPCDPVSGVKRVSSSEGSYPSLRWGSETATFPSPASHSLKGIRATWKYTKTKPAKCSIAFFIIELVFLIASLHLMPPLPGSCPA